MTSLDFCLLDFLKTFGINTTTNFDLYSIANFLEFPLEIYMKNEIPNVLPDTNIIFNYQNSNQNGIHWTCYKDNYYFDSFGLKPLDQLARVVKKYNNIQVQHFGTKICGVLCIYFLYKIQYVDFDIIINEMLTLYNSLL